MTTSGTTNFTLNILELAEEAWERASGGDSELRSGYDLRTARRSINLLTIEWAARGYNFWTLEQVALPLLPGVYQYTIPADTVDIIEAVIRQNPGSTATQTDLTISRISVSTYATIPNKLVPGRPIQYFLDRQIAPVINLWQVPPDSSYTFVYWRMRRIQDAGNQGNLNMDMPFRFMPAFVAGLAYYLSMKMPSPVASTQFYNNRLQYIQFLQTEYEAQFDKASASDRETAPLRFVPRQMIL